MSSDGGVEQSEHQCSDSRIHPHWLSQPSSCKSITTTLTLQQNTTTLTLSPFVFQHKSEYSLNDYYNHQAGSAFTLQHTLQNTTTLTITTIYAVSPFTLQHTLQNTTTLTITTISWKCIHYNTDSRIQPQWLLQPSISKSTQHHRL